MLSRTDLDRRMISEVRHPAFRLHPLIPLAFSNAAIPALAATESFLKMAICCLKTIQSIRQLEAYFGDDSWVANCLIDLRYCEPDFLNRDPSLVSHFEFAERPPASDFSLNDRERFLR